MVTEIKGTNANMTYDSLEHTVSVTVTEMANGDLHLWYDQVERNGKMVKIEHHVEVFVDERDGVLQDPQVTYMSTGDCPAAEPSSRGASVALCTDEAAQRFGNNHKPIPFELRKNVTELNGTADPDAEFSFKLTFYRPGTNSEPLYKAGESVQYVLLTTVTGADGKPENRSENKSVKVGDDGSMVLSFTASQRVRFEAVPYGTVFALEEVDLPFGFTVKSIAASNGYAAKEVQREDTNGKKRTTLAIEAGDWAQVAFANEVVVTAVNEYAAYSLLAAGGSDANIQLLAFGIALLCAGMVICMRSMRELITLNTD